MPNTGGDKRSEKGHLLRVLGVAFGLAAVVGSMVGQGILRTPGMVASAVPSPVMMTLCWLLGGLFAAAGAFAYIEMGAAMPSAGGPSDYAERAFGKLAGEITGWALFVAMIASAAGVNFVIGEFVVRLGVLPGLPPFVPALVALALFALVNLSGTKVSGSTQIVFSAVKGAVLVAIMVALFMHRGEAGEPVVAPVSAAGPLSLAGFAFAMRLIVSTYNGWQDIALYCEELERPERALPRSLFGGLAAVTALYVLFNLALLNVLTPAQMAKSDLPAADAIAVLIGKVAGTALTIFGVFSVAAITSLMVMSTTRIAFSLARAGLLPTPLAQVALNGTPRKALALVVLLMAGFIATGTYNSLSSTATALYQVIVVIVLLAAISLRRSAPNLPRPYRMPWFPLTMTVALAVNGGLLVAFIYDDPFNALLGVAIVAAMTLGWFLVRDRRA
ncbi:MAG: APC family permease [Novosphingobium sp.]